MGFSIHNEFERNAPINQTKGGTQMAKKLTTLYLDVEQEEKLKKLSVTTRVPKAVYTREAINLVLKKHEEEMRERQA